jgi:sugar porter (SP) family MFS transporter
MFATSATGTSSKVWSIRYLLLIAGLGGLLFGIDVGIIAGALPYLEATSKLNPQQLSFIVAAVLLGSLISTLFAGMLADLLGRKKLMILAGLLFVTSIPTIALADGYAFLICGRLLQGISGGLIAVVVPLYLAECLSASTRGKGTASFQWLLTLGILAATIVGFYISHRVAEVEKLADAEQLFAFKDWAWRTIFWVSLPPGALFVLGSLFLPESPRWLFRNGKEDAARIALLRTRTVNEAETEILEMRQTAAAESAKRGALSEVKESLLHRKYVIPFVLACIILACNQLTGINSVIQYNVTILIQAGLSDENAHLGAVIFTAVNFLATIVAVLLVDKKGRKFLLSVGTAGIILAFVLTGILFRNTEQYRVDCAGAMQKMVADGKLTMQFDQVTADELLANAGEPGRAISGKPVTLTVIYSCGDFVTATNAVRSDEKKPKTVEITRENCLPATGVDAFFKNPFASLASAREAPLKIDNALLTPIPSTNNGWLTAVLIYVFCAFFAIGPGVCVWLALTELMPTRIRSNGMSIALVLNHAASTTIAAIFLPTVGKYGYSSMFFAFAAFTVIYFVTATFFLPETKGKTLEEIEEHFSGHVKGKS